MEKTRWLSISMALCLTALLFGGAVALAQDGGDDEVGQVIAVAPMQDVDGNDLGEVRFASFADGSIRVEARLEGLEPGFHGFHIHETGTCDAAADPPFSSAGGHLALEGNQHPNHTGDLSSLLVQEDGTAYLRVETDRFTLDDLLDDDGSAVIVHAGADNFANIPERYDGPDEETLSAGDSGDRAACGVVQAGEVSPAGEGALGATEEPMDMMTEEPMDEMEAPLDMTEEPMLDLTEEPMDAAPEPRATEAAAG